MKSKDIIKVLKKDAWNKHHQKGSHIQFKHPIKPGKVTVPHPKKNIPVKRMRSIFIQAGLVPDND